MSTFTCQVTFTTKKRTLTFESTPSVIETLKENAIALGASRNEEKPYHLEFNQNSDETNEQCMIALEKIWENIPHFQSVPLFAIQIRCNFTSLFLEVDDETQETLCNLFNLFEKEIEDGVVTFSENEMDAFESFHSAIQAIGILPNC